MDLNFLTWNIGEGKKAKVFFEDLNAQLEDASYKIDILVLQECLYADHIGELRNFEEIDGFITGPGIRKWVRIFLNKKSNIAYSWLTSYVNNKLRCVELKTADGFVFNLMGAHFYSKARGKSDEQQSNDNIEVPARIEEFEVGKTQNSIIVGDLNYKPFDFGLTDPNFLNAHNDRNIIDIFETRKVKQKDGSIKNIRYLYNPMWNILGDHDCHKKEYKPAGTFYWYPNDVLKSHWNLIDGVLLTPSIMNNIVVESIKIVTEINGKKLIKTTETEGEKLLITEGASLLAKGFSDHLPVTFSLKTTQDEK